jgi:hypothetical protein
VNPLPGKNTVLECECGVIVGAIMGGAPDQRARVVCPACAGAVAKEHCIELSDRDSWEAALRIMETGQ